MKKSLCVLLMLSLFSCYLSKVVRATDVPAGNVSGVWTASDSPYNILGNIEVPAGESLLIEPGTEIHFAGAYYLRINGALQATGAEADSISFSWSAGNANSGIKIDNLEPSDDTLRFSHCRFTNLNGGRVYLNGADKVVFENNRITENVGHSGGAISVWVSTNVVIRNNLFDFNSASSSGYGGGLYIHDSSPLVENNHFYMNSASLSGGAISIWRSNLPVLPVIRNNVFEGNTASTGGALDIKENCVPHIEENEFIGNTAYYSGGAVWHGYVQAGEISFLNNIFFENSAPERGGAVRSIRSRVRFEGDVFEGNTSSTFPGGAVYMNDDNDATFTDVQFIGNHSNNGGAVAFEDEGNIAFEACTFLNNTANTSGVCYQNAHIESSFVNCLFANNESYGLGGIFRLTLFCDAEFVNCTFAFNHAANDASVASLYWDSDPSFVNCIFYGNTAEGGNSFVVQDYISNYCNPVFEYCLVEGGESAMDLGTSTIGLYENNIETDPLFVDPTAGSGAGYSALEADYRFAEETSPCLDIGTVEGLVLPETDLNGDLRIQGEAIDLGCYEGGGEVPIDTFPYEIDLNEDGVIDIEDLMDFLSNFGCTEDCLGDFDGDGVVSAADMVYFLGLFNL